MLPINAPVEPNIIGCGLLVSREKIFMITKGQYYGHILKL